MVYPCFVEAPASGPGKVAIDLLEKLLRDFWRVEIVASGDNVLTISNEGGNCG